MKLKKMMVITAAFSMALSVTACGSNNNSTNNGATTQQKLLTTLLQRLQRQRAQMQQ